MTQQVILLGVFLVCLMFGSPFIESAKCLSPGTVLEMGTLLPRIQARRVILRIEGKAVPLGPQTLVHVHALPFSFWFCDSLLPQALGRHL